MGITDILKETDLFDNLTEVQLKRIVQLAQRKEYKTGATLFIEGTSSDAMYIIEKGQVKITKSLGPDKEKTLNVLGDGDFFGEMAFLDQASRSATAKTITPAVIWDVSSERFNKTLMATEPQIAVKILCKIIKILSKRLRDTDEEVINMAQWALEAREKK